MEQKYTRHQVLRSAMPDAQKFNTMYLMKKVALLRPTYQIRLLAFRAVDQGMKLVLKVPAHCEFSEGLTALLAVCKRSVVREDF
ncbi:MAG TPA: hypothetical protein VGO52_23280 [Hyphomonadaceae bacterium]|jgi:hypothetical protein|nr:hypothetical protein [Hyphomonadaceae bacterium]